MYYKNKNIIETKRLMIIPLDCEELDYLINNVDLLEKKLNLKYDADKIKGDLKCVFNIQLGKCKNDPINYIWHTFWIIINKETSIIIGSIDFKDVPTLKTVEIGYGLGKKYENNGYMTETVEAFCEFAFNTNKVDIIIAETEKWNIKSQNVLLKNGFQINKNEETFWFIKKKIINT